MSRSRVLRLTSVLLPIWGWPASCIAPAFAQVLVQSNPMEVTSDTPEYCQHLLNRVTELIRLAAVPVPTDVTNLRSEGERMCDHGQTRGGIMRLRSAIMLMEKSDGSAYR